MTSPTLVLTITAELPHGEFQVTSNPAVIGRLATCAVPLPHRSVSREHAQISRVGDEFTVQDLGSKNGTWLNDQQVNAPTPLSDGDTLMIGDVPLHVVLSGADTAPQTLAAPPTPVPTVAPPPPLPRGFAVGPSTVMVGLEDVLSGSTSPPGPSPIAPGPPQPLRPVQPMPPVQPWPAQPVAAVDDDHPTVFAPLPTDAGSTQELEPQPAELVPFSPQSEPAAATLARLSVTADSLAAALRSLSGDLATAIWLFEHAGGDEAAQAFVECVNAAYLHPQDPLAQQAVLDEAPTAARLLQSAMMVLRLLLPQGVDAAAGRRDEP